MALGGGTFITQNKVLPGAYINVVSSTNASVSFGERGTVAAAVMLPTGRQGIFTVTNDQIQSDSIKEFGYSYGSQQMKNIRELFRHAQIVHFYNIKTEGQKASNTYATALYGGIYGNQLKIRIEADPDDENRLIVSTLFENNVVDEQRIKKVEGSSTTNNGLTDNEYVTFKKDVVPAATAATPLSGGTDGEYSEPLLQNALTAFEGVSFNVLFSDCKSTETSAIISYTNRMRNEYGKKIQAVIHDGNHSLKPDNEGIISVLNTVKDGSTETNCDLVYWTAGALAGCQINQSLTNTVYDGEYEINTDYSQVQLEEFIKAGYFVFHKVNNDVRVLMDINTLVTVTPEKGEVFKANQSIRVLDQIVNDIASLFNTKYLGQSPNDNAGRIALWNDIVNHHQEMQTIRAIENFNSEDVTVEAGTDKRAVVITDAVTVVNAMEKAYMTIVVQ